MARNLQLKVVSAPQTEEESNFCGICLVRGEIGSVGVVNATVLSYVLGRRLKQVVNFSEEKVHRRENPGYAYVRKSFQSENRVLSRSVFSSGDWATSSRQRDKPTMVLSVRVVYNRLQRGLSAVAELLVTIALRLC